MMARSSARAFLQVAIVAIFVRVILIIYGEWQDRFLQVKYTDVDYWVFSDAAAALVAGQSPYSRHTYRYTPLLALLLVPNSLLGNAWGKGLFAFFDIVAGYFIFRMLTRATNPTRAAYITAAFWLLNVMTFTISTRGNAESVLCALILASLYCLTSGHLLVGGIVFGTAVHLKIFPVIYSFAILAFLLGGKTRRSIDSPPMSPKLSTPSPTPSPNASPNSSPGSKARRRRARELASQRPSALSTPQKAIVVPVASSGRRLGNLVLFVVASIVACATLTGVCYWKYGMQYIQEAFLYHLTRKDHRHNFSPYFYLFYTEALLSLPKHFELIVFIPQAVFFIFAGLKFGKRDLPFACFIITHAFVTFNKVITSQVRILSVDRSIH